MKRYAVLTYIFGDYEKVHEVKEKDPDAEYILVTDDNHLTSSTWRVIVDRETVGRPVFERCFHVRYNPWLYTDADYVVRIDGSIGVNRSLKPVVDAFEEGGYDRCLMIHSDRNTIPDEYAAWVRIRNYPQEQANRCLDFIKRIGYDTSCRGLFQMCFEIVTRSPDNRILNSMTLDHLHYLRTEDDVERIDQTIFTVNMNHLFRDRIKVMPVSQNLVTDGNLMTWYWHNSDKPNTAKPTIYPVMFGKGCKTWEYNNDEGNTDSTL